MYNPTSIDNVLINYIVGLVKLKCGNLNPVLVLSLLNYNFVFFSFLLVLSSVQWPFVWSKELKNDRISFYILIKRSQYVIFKKSSIKI